MTTMILAPILFFIGAGAAVYVGRHNPLAGAVILLLATTAFAYATAPKPRYIYGRVFRPDDDYSREPVRLDTHTGRVQFVLWKAGEQGHTEDYWHDMGPGWEAFFIPNQEPKPYEFTESERLVARQVATALGAPYEEVLRGLRDADYRSARKELVEVGDAGATVEVEVRP